MKAADSKITSAALLRRSAKQRLRATPPAEVSAKGGNLKSAVQELHIYDAELQIQNEELLASRAQIEESQQKYFRHFDLAPVGLVRLNNAGVILEANMLGAQMMDVSRARLHTTPHHFLTNVAPESVTVFEQHLESARSSGKMEMCELLLRAAGRETFVRLQSVLSRAGEGSQPDFYVTITDLTEHVETERKLEMQLRRAQRLESIGSLASGVAHDLNNTLVPILIAAPVLRDALSEEDRLKFLDIVEASAKRGAQIVRQVLGFARGVESDRLLLQPNHVFMTPGLKPGPHVLIKVIDTGSGISPNIIDKIFSPFFTTKEHGRGTGLGLSTVLDIVKGHGGAVNVYSGPHGTTFRVLLPAARDAHPLAEHEEHPEIPSGHGETILLIDDESAIRTVGKAVLSQSGYNVLTADDGPSALAIFAHQSKEIAVVLTDSEMPIMSGLILSRTLRKMDSETKIILSTARDSDFSEADLINIGAQACLPKPYTRETLLRTVDRVLTTSLK